MTAPEPPAVPPAETEIPDFWWSTTGGLFYDINHPTSKVLNLVYADCARPITAPLRELPADAVRLVPEPEVLPLQVEVRNARKQHAADSEEIAELRGHIRELEATLRTELSRSTPGAVPDTGQAREPDWRRFVRRVQSAHQGNEQRRALLDLYALLDAEPSGDTVQARAESVRHLDPHDQVRALLGTDTTPDRLAWIGEAGETAAAERQARYQETACAPRPAEPAGDTDPLRASGRRFCEGDCSCGHDHERHGPEVPGCIECSCRITPEARQ